MFGHQHQVAPIRAIKAHIIHAKAMQRMISQIARDGAIPLDQSEINNPAQQTPRNPRRSAGPPCNFTRSGLICRGAQFARVTADNQK